MMQWSDDKDLEMMKKMAANGIFSYKSGSRERGQLWQTIATHLNSLDGFLVTKRSARYHFTTLIRKYKARMNKEVKGSGTAGDEPSEYEILIEDLIQLKLHLHLYRLLATTTKYIIHINFTLKQTSSENLDC